MLPTQTRNAPSGRSGRRPAAEGLFLNVEKQVDGKNVREQLRVRYGFGSG